MVGTIEGTTTHTIGLITEAIMDTHMVATTAGIIEGSGLASVIKTEEERGPKRVGWRRQQCVAFNSELQY